MRSTGPGDGDARPGLAPSLSGQSVAQISSKDKTVATDSQLQVSQSSSSDTQTTRPPVPQLSVTVTAACGKKSARHGPRQILCGQGPAIALLCSLLGGQEAATTPLQGHRSPGSGAWPALWVIKH